MYGLLLIFQTLFSGPENPLSEGGAWTHDAPAWHVVRKAGGLAMPSAQNVGYDDSYALLSGFPADVTITAKLYRDPAADCSQGREVELLLRMEDTSTTVRGYEVLYSCTERRATVMRWDGPMGAFVEIGTSLSNFDLANGDVLSATIQGTSISGYRNGVLVTSATDSTYADGQPGIGFFWRPGAGKAKDLAYTTFKAVGL